jgi:hypothetical protein
LFLRPGAAVDSATSQADADAARPPAREKKENASPSGPQETPLGVVGKRADDLVGQAGGLVEQTTGLLEPVVEPVQSTLEPVLQTELPELQLPLNTQLPLP